MRRGEILRLKWGDIDFVQNTIFIGESKNVKPAIIPINSYVSNTLQEWKKNNIENEFVFVNPKTKKPYKDITKPWYEALKISGISNLRFHDLRHSFCTRLAQSGIDPIHIAKLTRHSSLKMVERYAHPLFQDLRKAVETLSKDGDFLETQKYIEKLFNNKYNNNNINF